MEEQLISLETAKLAKEKGFDIPIKTKYVETQEHTLELGRGGDCIFPYIPPRILYNSSLDKYDTEIAKAPTQSLLQKWLRETHDIYVESYHDYDPKDGKYQYYTNWGFNDPNTIEKKQSGGYDEYNDWKNYEDALEFGLQQGLKMITEKK